MEYENLLYEKQGRVATFTLNRPERLNALNSDLRWELAHAYADFDNDPDLWVGILTGVGDRAFSAGMDVKERAAGMTPEQEARVEWLVTNGRDPNNNIFVTKPMIAAVHGWTLGAGLSIALQCDVIVAADDAKLAVTEVKRGLPPTWVLVRTFQAMPYHVAMEMNLTGDPLTAQEALHWGVVNKVVPLAELMDAAHAMADRILDAAPLGARAAKHKARLIQGVPFEQALRIDVGEPARLSEDLQEGFAAFAERRKPVWRGR
tara:strand:- start:975 stop:1757 length:783 start_codon:yes stop_codon:yes gene_type:complete